MECLSDLLERFGDGNDHVRDANQDLAQTIMANLSNAGKIISSSEILQNFIFIDFMHGMGYIQIVHGLSRVSSQERSRISFSTSRQALQGRLETCSR